VERSRGMGAAARGREVHPLAFHTVSRGRSKRGDVHHRLLSFFVGWATFLGSPLET
jgi:hypothetical protein